MSVNDLSLRSWNLGIMAAQGYAVVAINFHGSTGFGQSFTDSIRGDWGGAPFDDLMLGVDATLAKFAYLDPERVGALGASYGGFMMNWINGHTNRFKCLVNHDGPFSSHSMYYSTEELWFMEWEFHGLPWENPTCYDQWDAKRWGARCCCVVWTGNLRYVTGLCAVEQVRAELADSDAGHPGRQGLPRAGLRGHCHVYGPAASWSSFQVPVLPERAYFMVHWLWMLALISG
jgi:hypothetical protein